MRDKSFILVCESLRLKWHMVRLLLQERSTHPPAPRNVGGWKLWPEFLSRNWQWEHWKGRLVCPRSCSLLGGRLPVRRATPYFQSSRGFSWNESAITLQLDFLLCRILVPSHSYRYWPWKRSAVSLLIIIWGPTSWGTKPMTGIWISFGWCCPGSTYIRFWRWHD